MNPDPRPARSPGAEPSFPAPRSRREFLAELGGLLGGGRLALGLPALASLAACARDAAWRGEPLLTLRPAEARAMAALASRILPSDELPGAEEAGVLHFVDRGLGAHFAEHRDLLGAGLADLDGRARRADPAAEGFASLPAARQEALLREVEDTPFFAAARLLVVAGMFSDPSHGGNRDGAGWRLLGIEHAGSHLPPFGHYDAEVAA